MNSVSWFIYIAQVSQSLGAMFMVIGVVSAIGLIMGSLILTVSGSIENDKFLPRVPPVRYAVIIFILLLIGNLMPERNTMYAIAASQVGEQIVKSEAVQGVANDATKALQIWIKKQIDPAPEKK